MATQMQVPSRHIAWEQLLERIQEGIPFVYRIPAPSAGRLTVDIRVSEHGKELAMWIPCEDMVTPIISSLAEIDISVVTSATGKAIEIKTELPALFQEIYSFFVSICDKIQLDKANPFVAINETLDGWRDLLKIRTILSEEAQLGLRGELHLLRMLLPFVGDHILDAWTGPMQLPHDFRVGALEFEAKATCGPVHAHIINGLGQLEPSLGRKLYIYSIRLTPAGALAGTTLPEDIESSRLALSNITRTRFEKILKDRFAYREEHANLYSLRLQVADKPLLIPVDNMCPRMSVPLLASIPHRGRISDVRYRANFEGLGFAEGSIEFHSILASSVAQQ